MNPRKGGVELKHVADYVINRRSQYRVPHMGVESKCEFWAGTQYQNVAKLPAFDGRN
jgi:hypothetical protein